MDASRRSGTGRARSFVLVPALALLGLVTTASPGQAQKPIITDRDDVASTIFLRDLKIRDGAISGSVVNQSPRLVRNVRLLVLHTWHWKNEEAPGEDSPGRAAYHVLEVDIPAGGQSSFDYKPVPALPQRSDGHFETSIEIAGFTEVGD